MAPSTPPPPASDWLAALTMASTCRVVMSACCRRSTPSPTWCSCMARASLLRRCGDGQCGGVPAEAERGAHHELGRGLASHQRHVVEVARRVGVLEVDGG